MPKRAWKKLELVRCLGPGREHTFGRKPGSVQRICDDCRRKVDTMHLGKAASDPSRDPKMER